MESSPARAFFASASGSIVMDERADEALVVETLAGDRDAFAVLVRRYQDYAYATAVGAVADFDLGRDVVQEAFLCAFRDLDRLRAPSRFAGWLHGIVRRTAGTALRKRARHRNLAEKLRQKSASTEVAPDRQAEQAEVAALVHEALQRLTDVARETVCLYYVDGLSYREIAQYLSTTTTAVQGRLQRARAKLRKELAMIDETLKGNAPDEAFAGRVAEVVKVYTSRGPEGDLMSSEWAGRQRAQTRKLLHAGEEGFQIALALAASEHAKARTHAAVYLGLKGDVRGKEPLRRLMCDGNVKVRNRALRFYARLIHPSSEFAGNVWGPDQRADCVPDDVQPIIAALGDKNVKIRWHAVLCLGPYFGLGSDELDQALREALGDPKHKVRHAAAFQIGIPCVDCGAGPSK